MLPVIRGQYEALDRLGAGGMGEVYRARDLKLDRLVALKVLKAGPTLDPAARSRFIQEAKAASALNHPNIIVIYDIVDESDMEVMVMEYVAGKTLAELIPPGGLPVASVLNYGRQIADALGAAHRAGIIHRDLKPGNIMIGERDRLKVLDFGLAKLQAAQFSSDPDSTQLSPLTVQGSIIGTLSYMSPEQAQGLAVDGRSDIFSLGAILYEMATGKRAFSGANAISTLSSVLKEHPVPAIEMQPGLPGALDAIIRRSMDKHPEHRFQTMDEVYEALAEVSDSGRFQAAQSVSVPSAKPARKTSRVVPVIAAVLGLAAIGIGAWWIGSRRAATPVAVNRPSEIAPAVQPPTIPSQGSTPPKVTPPAQTLPKPSPMPQAPPPSVPAQDKPPSGGQVPPGREVKIADGTPIDLLLQDDVSTDAEEGAALNLTAASDVKVGGAVAIERGAPATGAVYSVAKKKQLLIVGRGVRVTYRLNEIASASGSKIKLRATPQKTGISVRPLEPAGPKPKNVAALKGSHVTAYVDGEQAVSLTQ